MDTPMLAQSTSRRIFPYQAVHKHMQLKGGAGFEVIGQSLFTHFVRSKVAMMMAQCTAHAN